MNSTIKYYDDNADEFIENTINLDMDELYSEFLSCIPSGGRILDVGCGSGRDSKFFIEHGYAIEAFDASKMMCQRASKYIGQKVIHATFEDYSSNEQFDGIWACASLLHVKKDKVSIIIDRLLTFLKDSGVMYASWKYGTFERLTIDGKYYCDLDEKMVKDFVNVSSGKIIKTWCSEGTRKENSEWWINTLIKKL